MFQETTFMAIIKKEEKKGGWTYVTWKDSVKFLGTGKAVKVGGTIDGHDFQATFLPWGDGTHMLPIKAAIQKVIKKQAGDTVEIRLTKKLESQNE